MVKRIVCMLIVMWLCVLTTAARDNGVIYSADSLEDGDVVVMTVPDTQGMAVGAKAAIVMEAGTGRVLFAQDANKRLPFASTTKIMTALITLEQPGLDIEFEVDAKAIRVEGSSMGLQEGDKATLRTLATGMLLPSGNDAANAAAVRISGSIPAFVELMNRRAKEIGMENTSFETPSGLDGENHYSTAYDLALLARTALAYEEFTDICSQYKMRVSYGSPPYDRWLTNHNKLLNYYEGSTGMKTGFTKKAGRCLVSTAMRDGVQLICVTLNCPNDWTTHENLFDYFFSQVQVEDLSKGIPPISIPVTGGVQNQVDAEKQDVVQVAVPVQGANVDFKISVQPFLYAPVTAGQTVGEVQVLLDGEVISTLQLTAAQDVSLLHPYEKEEEGFGDWLNSFLQELFEKINIQR